MYTCGLAGLLTSHKVQPFTSLCPYVLEEVSTTQDHSVTKGSPSVPCKVSSSSSNSSHQDDYQCEHHTIRKLHQRQKGLIMLSLLMCVVLLAFLLILLYKALCICVRRKPKNQRYKSVNKYFPFSHKKEDTDVIIPELGLPRSGSAERQVLLNNSDEDEL